MEQETPNSSSRQSILLVHGRDFKPAEAALLDVSLTAMRAGIERDYPDDVEAYDALPKDMAYYGDLTNAYLESIGRHYDEQLDLGDRHNALTALRAIPARKRFGIRQYDRLPGKSALREFVADIAAPVLGAFGMTRWLINCVSKDFCEYLCDGSEYASAVRQRVRDKLCTLFDRGDRVLLISHGTGCVATYEALAIDKWLRDTDQNPEPPGQPVRRGQGACQQGQADQPGQSPSYRIPGARHRVIPQNGHKALLKMRLSQPGALASATAPLPP